MKILCLALSLVLCACASGGRKLASGGDSAATHGFQLVTGEKSGPSSLLTDLKSACQHDIEKGCTDNHLEGALGYAFFKVECDDGKCAVECRAPCKYRKSTGATTF